MLSKEREDLCKSWYQNNLNWTNFFRLSLRFNSTSHQSVGTPSGWRATQNNVWKNYWAPILWGLNPQTFRGASTIKPLPISTILWQSMHWYNWFWFPRVSFVHITGFMTGQTNYKYLGCVEDHHPTSPKDLFRLWDSKKEMTSLARKHWCQIVTVVQPAGWQKPTVYPAAICMHGSWATTRPPLTKMEVVTPSFQTVVVLLRWWLDT